MTISTTAQTLLSVQPLSGTVTTRSERAAAQVARRTQLDARKASVFARATTEVLFGAVAALEAKHDAGTPLDEAEQTTRAWILGEIERRHPAVDPLMDAWVESDADPRTYSRALMAAVAATTPAPAEVSARPTISGEEKATRRTELSERIAEMRRMRERLQALAARYPGRVHLQSIGSVPAIPTGDLRPGDVTMYNGGGTGVVISVTPKGKASCVLVTEQGGRRYEQVSRLATLQAIAHRPGDAADVSAQPFPCHS